MVVPATMLRSTPCTGPREPWDFGRFVKTVLFFNEPPPLPKLLQNIASAPFKLLQGVSSGDLEVALLGIAQCVHSQRTNNTGTKDSSAHRARSWCP